MELQNFNICYEEQPLLNIVDFVRYFLKIYYQKNSIKFQLSIFSTLTNIIMNWYLVTWKVYHQVAPPSVIQPQSGPVPQPLMPLPVPSNFLHQSNPHNTHMHFNTAQRSDNWSTTPTSTSTSMSMSYNNQKQKKFNRKSKSL